MTGSADGGGVALEGLGCMVLIVDDDEAESLWVRMRGKANKVDVVMAVYHSARMTTQMDYSTRN